MASGDFHNNLRVAILYPTYTPRFYGVKKILTVIFYLTWTTLSAAVCTCTCVCAHAHACVGACDKERFPTIQPTQELVMALPFLITTPPPGFQNSHLLLCVARSSSVLSSSQSLSYFSSERQASFSCMIMTGEQLPEGWPLGTMMRAGASSAEPTGTSSQGHRYVGTGSASTWSPLLTTGILFLLKLPLS